MSGRRRRAAGLLSGVAVAVAVGAWARPAPEAASLVRALRASDFAGVVEVRSGAGALAIVVLERLSGSDPGRPIVLGADSEGCGRLDVPLVAGETALLMLGREGERWDCLPGWQASHVPLAAGPRTETVALVRAIVAALAAVDPARVDEILRGAIATPNERLRAGVLFDLGERLVPGDVPFLLALARDRTLPLDVRSFALGGLTRFARQVETDELAALLDPSEPETLRQAALQAAAARHDAGARSFLELGLADESAAVRRVAVENLSGEAAVPALAAHFADERDTQVRVSIARRLGQIGGAEAIGSLREILAAGAEPAVRRAAQDSLAVALAAERP